MSECRTCSFAAYDGTCLAKGKLTVLDAPACELYRSTAAAQIAELKCENAELRRELVRDLLHHIEYPPCEGCLSEMSCAGDLSQCDEYFDWLKPRARKLGVEVDE